MPSCTNCTRLSKQCSLVSITPVRFFSRSKSKIERTAEVLLSPRGPSGNLRDFAKLFPNIASNDVLDDELFHHYTTSTYAAIGANKALDVWSMKIPQLALEHPFLMHGLLAVTAIHLADINPQRHYLLVTRALRHKSFALPLFRQLISEITEQNCHAIFTFSSFVIPYALASLDSSESENLIPSNSGRTPNWMSLIRGAHGLLYNNWRWLLNGPFAPLLERTKFPIDFANNPDDGYLTALLPVFSPPDPISSDDQTALDICRGAFDELRRVYALPYSPCKTVDKKAAATIWPGTISPAYIQLLRERRPEAIIILAYYCVLVHQVPNCWYFRGFSEKLLSATCQCLSPGWRTWIDWPLEQLNMKGK